MTMIDGVGMVIAGISSHRALASCRRVPLGLLVAGLLGQPLLSHANEYLPPPTGPYQSSVVVNTGDNNAAQKVYRFPPADLVQTQPKPPREGLPRRFDFPAAPGGVPPVNANSKMPAPVTPREQLSQPPMPAMDANPWAVNPQQPFAPDAQGVWGNPYGNPYGNYGPYTYPYPYGYGEQHNRNKNFFSNMPSPWSVMPVQPYQTR